MDPNFPLQYFPYLTAENSSRESPVSDDYNCIAWACGLDDCQLWPDSDHEWPEDLPQEESLDSIAALFERDGYLRCEGPDLEPGIEKVAIYARGTHPTHVARQLESGRWASKLGYNGLDIEHNDLSNVETPHYGTATVFLRRPRQ